MQLIPADHTPNQAMTIRYLDDVLQLTIVWNSIGHFWSMDIFDVAADEYVAQYVPLDVGTPIGERFGRQWVFVVVDLSNVPLDPMRQDDLGSRCLLMISTITELKALVWALYTAP